MIKTKLHNSKKLQKELNEQQVQSERIRKAYINEYLLLKNITTKKKLLIILINDLDYINKIIYLI